MPFPSPSTFLLPRPTESSSNSYTTPRGHSTIPTNLCRFYWTKSTMSQLQKAFQNSSGSPRWRSTVLNSISQRTRLLPPLLLDKIGHVPAICPRRRPQNPSKTPKMTHFGPSQPTRQRPQKLPPKMSLDSYRALVRERFINPPDRMYTFSYIFSPQHHAAKSPFRAQTLFLHNCYPRFYWTKSTMSQPKK